MPHFLVVQGCWSGSLACDKLIQATKTLDIGLIRDEANVAAPHREPQVEVPPLGADLVADVEQMQAPLETKHESAPTTPVDNTVSDALFEDEMPPPASSRNAGKLPHSSRAYDDTEVGRVSKRERQETEAAQRASIIDEELWQQRIREVGVGASSSVSTTDGAVRINVSTTEVAETVDAGTTEGDPIVNPAGSMNPDPSAY
uniref:Integrase core domain containing protein n=1 Tax=Solanum tuberosum TaxID=4113 RepID=M1D9N3_SOLTU